MDKPQDVVAVANRIDHDPVGEQIKDIVNGAVLHDGLSINRIGVLHAPEHLIVDMLGGKVFVNLLGNLPYLLFVPLAPPLCALHDFLVGDGVKVL